MARARLDPEAGGSPPGRESVLRANSADLIRDERRVRCRRHPFRAEV